MAALQLPRQPLATLWQALGGALWHAAECLADDGVLWMGRRDRRTKKGKVFLGIGGKKLKAREAAAALEGDAEELEAGEAEDAEGGAADSEPAGERAASERAAAAVDVYQGEEEHEVDDELAAEYGSADEYDDADAYATDSDFDVGGGSAGAYDEDAYGDEGDGMQSGDAPSGRAEAFSEKYGTDLYSADEPEGDVDDVGSVRPDAGEALPRRPSAGAAKAGRRPAR